MEGLKKELYNACVQFIRKREETVHQIITSNQKALISETKSSAGDKHETGRAMLQLEMEKTSQQLEGIYSMKTTLAKLKLDGTTDVVKLGNMVITDQANYFIAISMGEILISEKKYFSVSPGSPIGRLLLGKRVNDVVVFNGKSIKIDAIQ